MRNVSAEASPTSSNRASGVTAQATVFSLVLQVSLMHIKVWEQLFREAEACQKFYFQNSVNTSWHVFQINVDSLAMLNKKPLGEMGRLEAWLPTFANALRSARNAIFPLPTVTPTIPSSSKSNVTSLDFFPAYSGKVIVSPMDFPGALLLSLSICCGFIYCGLSASISVSYSRQGLCLIHLDIHCFQHKHLLR